MNKYLVTSGFLIFTFACVFAQEVGSSRWVQQEALRLQNMPIYTVDASQVSNEHRDKVLKEVRKRLDWSLAIRLRDKRTIDEYIGRFISTEGKDVGVQYVFQNSKSPWLLPKLAPLLNKDAAFKRRIYGEGSDDVGYPHLVAALMRDILHDSPEIPADVRESFQYRGENPWLLAGMRRWWEENSEAIENEKYGEVTRLEYEDFRGKTFQEVYGVPTSKSTQTPNPILTPAATPTPAAPPASIPTSTPIPEPTSVPQVPDPVETSHSSWWLWILLGAVALGVAGVMVKWCGGQR